LFGGMVAFAWGIWFLDWLGRRQHRRSKGINR
jgi:hypothetical protein